MLLSASRIRSGWEYFARVKLTEKIGLFDTQLHKTKQKYEMIKNKAQYKVFASSGSTKEFEVNQLTRNTPFSYAFKIALCLVN